MLKDLDKQKLRDAWQRALNGPVADMPIVIHPDGRKKTPREMLERRLNDPAYAESAFRAVEKSIELGFTTGVDDYIEKLDTYYKQTPQVK